MTAPKDDKVTEWKEPGSVKDHMEHCWVGKRLETETTRKLVETPSVVEAVEVERSD